MHTQVQSQNEDGDYIIEFNSPDYVVESHALKINKCLRIILNIITSILFMSAATRLFMLNALYQQLQKFEVLTKEIHDMDTRDEDPTSIMKHIIKDYPEFKNFDSTDR